MRSKTIFFLQHHLQQQSTRQFKQPVAFPTCISASTVMSSSLRLPIIRQHHSKVPAKAQDSTLSIASTPLGCDEASHLLEGLDVFEVKSELDWHPLTVYGIHSTNRDELCKDRRPILLLHGRTWSSVPVYHLLGGSKESRSLMEALYDTHSLQPYCMDFRGFGGTPADDTHEVRPHVCMSDAETALKWISDRHNCPASNKQCEMPALFGWSQGALVAQLIAQKSPHLMSKLVLYGSIYDPMVRYPRAPLYAFSALGEEQEVGPGSSSSSAAGANKHRVAVPNTYDAAIEDFTMEGTIAPEPARQFAHAALLCDPSKAQWTLLHEFNNVDPARVHVPTLVVAGDQDPYAPLRVQQELFSNLGRGLGNDRSWCILSNADHAVHLLDGGRDRLVKTVTNFVENALSTGK